MQTELCSSIEDSSAVTLYYDTMKHLFDAALVHVPRQPKVLSSILMR